MRCYLQCPARAEAARQESLMRRSLVSQLLIIGLVAATLFAPGVATPAAGAQADDVVRIITTDTGPDYLGWLEFEDGQKQWLLPDCRATLEADGVPVAMLPWAEIDAMPNAPQRDCGSLRAAGDEEPDGELPLEQEAADNLALILSNPGRNTSFDDNPFRGVPADEITVEDLTVNADIYNEGLLDTTNSGYFRVKCEVSHFAYDDPIVFPNEPGRAHLHMFFGNTEANAYSTFDSLLNSGTGTCNGEDLNRTAYWVPAMLDSDGNALIPFEVMVYYKNDNFRLNGANELVEPFPDNLRMIAGNASATSPQTTLTGPPGTLPVISFSCGPAYNSNHLRQPLIPDCYGTGEGPYQGRALEMQIAFPQCLAQMNNDIAYLDDQSHSSYSDGGYYAPRCPASHPVDISSVMYRIFFSPDDYGGSLTDLHLSSDVKPSGILPGGTTAHADWFGAWHPDAMDMWVENCNNTQADCETGLLNRSPAVSLVLRERGFYPPGHTVSAEDLIQLCPGKSFDESEPLQSVANCRHH